MTDREHIRILREGPDVWNKWREQDSKIQPRLARAFLKGLDLSSYNLVGANLSHCNLRGACLHRANLTYTRLLKADIGGADLRGADLSYATLSGANLKGANLKEAVFKGTDFTNAVLKQANLIDSSFNGADFTNADFTLAIIGLTTFANVDLSRVKGLDSVHHRAPSTIGVSTIYQSKGDIPENFLRRAGLPDNFINYVASLTGKAFEFYSCFISYSSKDQPFANRLYADLETTGVRCWFAPEDLKIGDITRIAIDESIRKHDKLLLILSKHSVLSDWVGKEVETAMEKERVQRRTDLFPLRIDNTVMEIQSGWAADIRRTRNIGDFRKWKTHAAYQGSFARLLRDLRSEDSE